MKCECMSKSVLTLSVRLVLSFAFTAPQQTHKVKSTQSGREFTPLLYCTTMSTDFVTIVISGLHAPFSLKPSSQL